MAQQVAPHRVDDGLATLSVRAEEHDKKFPYFRRPQIVGNFSLDETRGFHHDRRQLKFYRPRRDRIRLDLNEGLDLVERKDEERCKKERLDHLLQWILLNKDKFAVRASTSTSDEDKKTAAAPESGLNSLSTDFVCFRGCLSMVMCTPYQSRDSWTVTAVKWRGTIYLHKEETDEQRRQRTEADERQKTMSSWGYKFEQFMMSDDPAKDPDTEEPVKEAEEFCCIFRTRLGGHSLVFGAEMDGLVASDSVKRSVAEDALCDLDLNRETFLELKTSRVIEHRGQERNFRRFKMIKWWTQSFLAGVPTVTCGFRDDQGTVTEIRDFALQEMPKLCADSWLPNVCMNFLHDFLALVKSTLDGRPESSVVAFSYATHGSKIDVQGLERCVVAELLPDWFTSKVFT